MLFCILLLWHMVIWVTSKNITGFLSFFCTILCKLLRLNPPIWQQSVHGQSHFPIQMVDANVNWSCWPLSIWFYALLLHEWLIKQLRTGIPNIGLRECISSASLFACPFSTSTTFSTEAVTPSATTTQPGFSSFHPRSARWRACISRECNCGINLPFSYFWVYWLGTLIHDFSQRICVPPFEPVLSLHVHLSQDSKRGRVLFSPAMVSAVCGDTQKAYARLRHTRIITNYLN